MTFIIYSGILNYKQDTTYKSYIKFDKAAKANLLHNLHSLLSHSVIKLPFKARILECEATGSVEHCIEKNVITFWREPRQVAACRSDCVGA